MTIDPLTLQAYQDADYRVLTKPPFVLHADQHSHELASTHTGHGATSSTLITACNPHGKLLDKQTNTARQQALAADLTQHGFDHLPAIGLDPTGQWPGEASFLVFNLPLKEAMTLGRELGQNAILWADADAIPRLVLLV